MTVRRALPSELKAIMELERACAEAPHWSETLWMDMLAKDESTEPARATFVAEYRSELIGFVVVGRAGEVAEVESIAVAEANRRQGVGRALCAEAITWARGGDAQEIDLEVRASSSGALALYRSLGFIENGLRPSYYRDPTDDAVLMSAPLRP
jgi:[ribosomal protein S18]-alanine N-acetyltransferase